MYMGRFNLRPTSSAELRGLPQIYWAAAMGEAKNHSNAWKTFLEMDPSSPALSGIVKLVSPGQGGHINE